jgi:hypothetical protein
MCAGTFPAESVGMVMKSVGSHMAKYKKVNLNATSVEKHLRVNQNS